jgi:hypothetical protein
VWLGYAALVLPGVTIGHGAVVAAASVVAADVPAYAVVAGNPARVVRRRFDDGDVARLLRAAWWNWPIDLVTKHARTIMAGTPTELERVAAEEGLLTSCERPPGGVRRDHGAGRGGASARGRPRGTWRVADYEPVDLGSRRMNQLGTPITGSSAITSNPKRS